LDLLLSVYCNSNRAKHFIVCASATLRVFWVIRIVEDVPYYYRCLIFNSFNSKPIDNTNASSGYTYMTKSMTLLFFYINLCFKYTLLMVIKSF